jgi:hypothetical protein
MISIEDMEGLEYLAPLHNDVEVYQDKEHLYFLRLNWTGKEYEVLSKIRRENE